jgi:hypothetical protein
MSALSFKPDIARQLFDNLDQIHLVYIHPNGIGVRGHDFGTDANAALKGAQAANANGYNVYWTVNHVRPGLHTKPSKADIRSARFVHVDIDPPKSGGAFNKGEITAALLEIDQPPSFVIDSGGGLQAFWRLDGPCANLASIEAINIQARDWFDADACQNIDRLMRVPGSVNWPDKKKIARGRTPKLATWASEDDGLVYEPEELAAGFPPANPTVSKMETVAVNIPADIEMVTPDSLGLSSLDPIRLAIETPPGYDSSGDGLAAARLMANAGHSDAAIMGTLLNPANTVSAHFLAQRDPRRAAARAIQLVRQDSPQEGETLHAPVMSDEQWNAFVANCKAKVRSAMVPAALREDDGEGDIGITISEYEGPERRADTRDPQWLADLGDGTLAAFVRHVIAVAPSPQPWLTLGAALAMFGAAAGRRYAGPTDLRTNIYSIGIARSGSGKDYPLRAATRLLIDAGLANHVGGSKIASGSGLITAVTRNPSIFFPLDEVGFLIAAAADRKRSPKHIVEVMDTLTEFYPIANSTFLGTAYANDKEKPREVIEQPCLCLFGVTTPRIFWGSLSSANMEDGSLARMIIFESENDYPDLQHDIAAVPMPDHLIEATKAISRGAEGHNPFPLGNSANVTPKPYMVPYADTEAEQVARDMRETQLAMQRNNQNEQVSGIIGRLAENAFKIALIKSITDCPASPMIATRDLEWGMMISRISVEALMRAAEDRVADSEHETIVKRVMRIISEAGSAGIDGTKLSRKTQFLDRRKRADIIAGMIEAGMVRAMKIPKADKGGPETTIYFDIA